MRIEIRRSNGKRWIFSLPTAMLLNGLTARLWFKDGAGPTARDVRRALKDAAALHGGLPLVQAERADGTGLKITL